MSRYIYGERDGVHIFDLVKTKAGLDTALEGLKKLASEDKTILFVGTKRQAQEIVKRTAEEVGMPFIIQKWPGGVLTNFEQIRKSVRRMVDQKEKREKGELKKYTKREQLLIDRDIQQLEKTFGGIVALEKLPDALFVVDTHRETVSVHEAHIMNVPVFGLVDTNGSPNEVDYVIPTNDDAVKAIELMVTQVGAAIREGKNGKSKS